VNRISQVTNTPDFPRVNQETTDECEFDQRWKGASLAGWICAMWRRAECQDANVADGILCRDVSTVREAGEAQDQNSC
jgi:hypothetical protein